jgi:8-oxo-dGTP pyrophosphatase MutT (NUDIX family)
MNAPCVTDASLQYRSGSRGPVLGTGRVLVTVSVRNGIMPIPEFIVALRQHIGHAPLWLTAITAVVIHDQQVLLIQRSDNRAWTPVTGIIEPGENPADCAVREVFEESGIHAVARRLAWVHVTRPMVHVNGDHAQYLDHVFRMDWVGGEPFPADDESLAARWFDLADTPDMSDDMRRRIELARGGSLDSPTVFETGPS